MKIVDTKFDIGDTVYLKTDSDQKIRMVTAIMFKQGDSILYELCCGADSRWHYEMEISAEKNVLV